MDNNTKAAMESRVQTTIKNLEKNNMKGFYVKSKDEVVDKVKQLLSDGDTVAVGGSMSLFESGVIDYLRCGKYKFLDRYEQGLTRPEIEKVFRDSFFADTYFTSTNALTVDGQLYNVDGNGNRVAAMMYGPKSLIVIAGYNKIVNNLDEAINRVKSTASPANCERLSKDTYCKNTGECMAINKGMTDGCNSENRICRSYTVIAMQPKASDRIKVIIVGEELGY